jgi:single-strand DNA-binding protein
MNKVIIMGRLARDPEVHYTQVNESTAIARYTLAVDRRVKREGEQTADFIGVVAFGRAAEFAEKYCHKGTKLLVTGRIQTGSYTNRDGNKVYTTDVIAEDQEFCESKKSTEEEQPKPQTDADGFINVPEGIYEDLPFATPGTGTKKK